MSTLRALAASALIALVSCAAPRVAPVIPAPVVEAPKPVAKVAPPAEPELVFPEEPYRAKAPTPGEVKASAPPRPQVFKLANGIEVLLVERHALPTVSMDLTFDGGNVDDPKGKEGLSSVCMALLSEGTRKLDKVAFREALGDLASAVQSYAAPDQRGVMLASLTGSFDATLALWADVVLRPGLRPDELGRMIKQRQAALRQAKGDAAAVSGRVGPSIIYGPGHPYGRVPTESTLGALTVKDCTAYAAARMKPAGAKLFVVGDVTRAELETKLKAQLKGWTGKPAPMAKLEKGAPREGRVFLVDVPGARQTVISAHLPGPSRLAPDYDETSVMSGVLGGGFSSRINMNLREKHGYSYGASGGFIYARGISRYAVQSAVRNDVAGAAIDELLKELRDIRAAEVTPDELTREKDGALLALPARFASGRSILATFQSLVRFGLPLDDFEKLPARIRAVDAAQVLKAAQTYIDPAQVKLLVVGDAKTLRPQLDKLMASGDWGKGPIIEVDTDGVVH